jgi:hypothetical protein
MGASKTICVCKELMYLTNRLPPCLITVACISARPLAVHEMKTVQVVLMKKQYNWFLQSFWQCCRWSKDWNTAVTCTCCYVLGSEWWERLFQKLHYAQNEEERKVWLMCCEKLCLV